MTARTLLTCATAGILTLASLHADPQFRSLTPAAQTRQGSASWVKHLNDMNEAERKRRVQTYGMPTAPPNRWANRSAPQRPVVQPTPGRAAPQSLYQNRPATVAAKVRHQPVRQTQPARPQAQPVRLTPPVQPQAQTMRFTPPPSPPKRSRLVSWKPSQVKKKPAVISRQDALRQQVAFMPTNSTSLAKSNPYAPYGSKREYEQATRRSQWQPRARSAEILQDQKRHSAPAAKPKSKRRWGLSSLFKRKKTSSKSSSKRSTPATRSRVPNSTLVTAGLPQSNDDSGSMIETTLFGN